MAKVRGRPIQQAFGDRVRARRRALGLSQEELAERAGMHRNSVGVIERGQMNTSLVKVVQLAIGLESDPGELIAGIHERVSAEPKNAGRARSRHHTNGV